jgi:hypothetical protein
MSVTHTSTGDKTTTAASYERVSTLMQARFGYSLGAQEKDSRQFCAERDWELPEDLIFKDGEDRNASAGYRLQDGGGWPALFVGTYHEWTRSVPGSRSAIA